MSHDWGPLFQAYQTGYEEVFDRYFYHVNVVRAYHTLTPWYSPSDSFLQVEPLTGTVSCSGMLDVKLRHISPGASPQELTFYYKVSVSENLTRVAECNKTIVAFSFGVLFDRGRSLVIALSMSIARWLLKMSDYPLAALPRVFCDVDGGNRIQTGFP